MITPEDISAKKTQVLVLECEVYSRVVGYYRPVQNFNAGKQLEFHERKFLKWKETEKEIVPAESISFG